MNKEDLLRHLTTLRHQELFDEIISFCGSGVFIDESGC
jgi:hypothetical protein